MARWKGAVVGCGGMGRCHLSAFQYSDRMELAGACDLFPETLARRAAEFPMPPSFTDLHELLEKVRPDVVGVATQTRQHLEVVLACAEAGVKGILCEKPLGLDLAECDAMVEACERHGIQLAVNHQGRLHPATQRAQALVEAGELGDLILVRGVNKGGRKAGNELMEMGTHTTDRMLCFGGQATWCFANLTWEGRDAGREEIMDAKEMSPKDRDSGWVLGERLFAQYGFERCPFGEMTMLGWQPRQSYGVDVIGSRGQLMLRGSRMEGGLYHLPFPTYEPGREGGAWRAVTDLEPNELWGSLDDSTIVMYHRLLEAIETGEAHPSSGATGRHALEMVMATYESHWKRARVELPLVERTHPLARWRAAAA